MDAIDCRTAVITGGHGYDLPNFHRLFGLLSGIVSYVQNLEDFATSPKEVRDSYDVLVFYNMHKSVPEQGKIRQTLEHLAETEQGILLLHHAILAFPEWAFWNELAGIENRSFQFFDSQALTVEVADGDHPITQGLSGWEMIDETYTMNEPDKDENEVLLTTRHDPSMSTLGWVRTPRDRRVFCFQSGHDAETWRNENFQNVLRKGILWCGKNL